MREMKTQTRRISEREYEALVNRIEDCPRLVWGSAYLGLHVWMLDDEFQPTQRMAEVRWIYAENNYGYELFQVDNAGTAVLLTKESHDA